MRLHFGRLAAAALFVAAGIARGLALGSTGANAANLDESVFSGKTRALNATHVSAGARLWSALPYLRPMATITRDTLDWYGFDSDGAGVHELVQDRLSAHPPVGRVRPLEQLVEQEEQRDCAARHLEQSPDAQDLGVEA